MILIEMTGALHGTPKFIVCGLNGGEIECLSDFITIHVLFSKYTTNYRRMDINTQNKQKIVIVMTGALHGTPTFSFCGFACV